MKIQTKLIDGKMMGRPECPYEEWHDLEQRNVLYDEWCRDNPYLPAPAFDKEGVFEADRWIRQRKLPGDWEMCVADGYDPICKTGYEWQDIYIPKEVKKENMENKTGIELIAQERAEQIEKHGWNSEHDSQHRHGELAIQAAVLAALHTDAYVVDPDNQFGSGDDPWRLEEKLQHDQIHCLKVAGALIAAEIDRLQAINKALL